MTAAILCGVAPAARQLALLVQIRIGDAESGKSQVVALHPRGNDGIGTISSSLTKLNGNFSKLCSTKFVGRQTPNDVSRCGTPREQKKYPSFGADDYHQMD